MLRAKCILCALGAVMVALLAEGAAVVVDTGWAVAHPSARFLKLGEGVSELAVMDLRITKIDRCKTKQV